DFNQIRHRRLHRHSYARQAASGVPGSARLALLACLRANGKRAGTCYPAQKLKTRLRVVPHAGAWPASRPGSFQTESQLPITPPSFLVMMTVDERGSESPPSGQWLSPSSPGCWMLMNIVLLSGVKVMPVTSHSFGPTKKR